MITRLLTRVALVKALSYKPEGGQYQTLAGERVFDSRMSPIEMDVGKVEIPVIVVYTVDQATIPGKKDTGPSLGTLHQSLDIEIEIAVARYETKAIGKQKKTTVEIVQNDEELVGVLDLFEAQVWYVLHDTMNPWSRLFAKLVRNATGYKSELQADGESNNALAMRRITVSADICADPTPKPGILPPGETYTPQPFSPDDLGSFVDTYLREMIAELLTQSDTETILAALRSTLAGQQGILLPALGRIGVIMRGAPVPEDPKGLITAEAVIKVGDDNG